MCLKTALQTAALQGALQNVELLLEFGADLLAQDDNGQTALDLAEQGEHTACMKVLMNAAGKYLILFLIFWHYEKITFFITGIMTRERVENL